MMVNTKFVVNNYNKNKIQFEFPVVKRKQKLRAQNAEKAAEADDESND